MLFFCCQYIVNIVQMLNTSWHDCILLLKVYQFCLFSCSLFMQLVFLFTMFVACSCLHLSATFLFMVRVMSLGWPMRLHNCLFFPDKF